MISRMFGETRVRTSPRSPLSNNFLAYTVLQVQLDTT